MLSSAVLLVADRLATALMPLVRAVVALTPTPTLPDFARDNLALRLINLLTNLIRISNFGVRAKPKPTPTPEPQAQKPPRPPTHRPARPSFPRRPGWLLALLPEIAPAVAADFQALLADPAVATLLEAAPTLHRALRPLFRSLGLEPAPPPIQPAPSPPSAPAPTQAAAGPPTRHPPRPDPDFQFAT